MAKFICAKCGEEFEGRNRKERPNQKRFCSKKCQKAYKTTKIKCEKCGRMFEIPKSRVGIIHLCEDCRGANSIIKNKCLQCGVDVKTTKSALKSSIGYFCSAKCRDIYTENQYNQKENYTELIINSPKNGKIIVFIDTEDIEKCQQYKWRLSKNYVISNNGSIKLHRIITNCPSNLVVDHLNHNTLDNRKVNLKICTSLENSNNVLSGKYIREFHTKNRYGKEYIYYRCDCVLFGKSIVKYFPFSEEGYKRAIEYVEEFKKQHRPFLVGGSNA